MLIDWFTVIAQIVNFLILVWFLKRFLYKPILNAIDEREHQITTQINEAAERNTEAEKEKVLFHLKNEVFEKERETLRNEALNEILAEKQTLLDSVNREVDLLRAKRQESLLEEEHSLQQEIVQKTQAEVFAMTRKVLEDLASVSLEEQMATVFLRQIKSLPSDEMDKLIRSFRSSPKPVILRSAFELPQIQQREIQGVVSETFGMDASVQFETSQDLIGGIELVTNGYKVAWSIADTLSTAGKHASKVLRDKIRPVPQNGGTNHGSA